MMVYLKKLLFAPVFLGLVAYSVYLLKPYLTSYGVIFAVSYSEFINLLVFSGTILFSAITFAVFSCLAQDWKLIGPVSFFAGAPCVYFLPQPLSFVIAGALILSLVFNYLMLENSLKNYFTFKPTELLGPSIKSLTFLIVLVFSIGFYLSINKEIQTKGFEIPDTLIDQALKLSPQPEDLNNIKGIKFLAQTPLITQEQIDFLKKNPDLVKQAGYDPKILDNYSAPTPASSPKTQQSSQKQQTTTQLPSLPGIQIPTSSADLTKKLIKSQFQKMIDPYKGIIPGVLALLFFVALNSLVSLLGIFNTPITWFVFQLLQSSGFIRFEKEMREVKKMAV